MRRDGSIPYVGPMHSPMTDYSSGNVREQITHFVVVVVVLVNDGFIFLLLMFFDSRDSPFCPDQVTKHSAGDGRGISAGKYQEGSRPSPTVAKSPPRRSTSSH